MCMLQLPQLSGHAALTKCARTFSVLTVFGVRLTQVSLKGEKFARSKLPSPAEEGLTGCKTWLSIDIHIVSVL